MTKDEDPVPPELCSDLTEIARELRRLTKELQRILRSSLYYKVRFWATMGGCMTAHLGAVLFFGAPSRVSATAYTMIADYGGGRVWGGAFIAAAIFTLLCAWKLHSILRWALLVEAALYVGIAISFVVASIIFPNANLTAGPVYGWVAVAHAFLSDVARREFLVDQRKGYGSPQPSSPMAERPKRAARTSKRSNTKTAFS